MSDQQLQTQGETAKYLAGKAKALETLLPAHMTPERFLRVVFLQMQKTPTLAACTKESLYAGMMSAAELGVMPDGRQGYLIPYRNNRADPPRTEAQFQISYMGIMDRARQSGEVRDIYAASIHENDEFTYELGFNRELIHRPNLRGDRGPIVAVYCVVELKDGAKTFGPGPMTVDEVNAIRARSKAAHAGPWVSDWQSMAWKTIIKRVLKWVPQSSELRGIIDLDDSQYETAAPEPPKPVTINDLMTSQGPTDTGAAPPAEEPKSDKRQSPPADDPGKPAEREWPKWVPKEGGGGHWVDPHGVIYDPDVHAGYQGRRPPLTADDTFRARKGKTNEAAIRLEEARSRHENQAPPAGDGEGESGDSGAAGPGQDDAGAGDQAADGDADETLAKAEKLTRQAIAIIERCQTVDQLNEAEEVALDMVRGTGGVKAVEDAAVHKYRELRAQ